ARGTPRRAFPTEIAVPAGCVDTNARGVRGSRELDAAVEAAKGRTIPATGPQVAAVVLPYFAIAGTVLASWQSPSNRNRAKPPSLPIEKIRAGWQLARLVAIRFRRITMESTNRSILP